MLRLIVAIGRPAKEHTGHAADFIEAVLPSPLYPERPEQKDPGDGKRDAIGQSEASRIDVHSVAL